MNVRKTFIEAAMKNQNIGALGEAFIQKRLDFGYEFEAAWAEWQKMQDQLMFVLVEVPEVVDYDNRRKTDAQERLRLRRLAKRKFGKHIRSADVSCLAQAGSALGVAVPVRRYHMDRGAVSNWLLEEADRAELEHGCSENAAWWREQAADDAAVEEFAELCEMFAVKHALWAVPPERLTQLFRSHLKKLAASVYPCEACGQEMTFVNEPGEGCFQEMLKTCPRCGCHHEIEITYDGEEPFVEGRIANVPGKDDGFDDG